MADLDITGGYDPDLDYFLPVRPENPKMRDSASIWISDSKGRFGLPRFCIEAVASEWDNRGVEANIAFPDGRVLIGAGGFATSETKFVDGKAVTLNAGPLTFELVEPLRRWRMTFDGKAYETTVERQIASEIGGPERQVRIAVEATMVVPPWSPGESAKRSGDQATTAAFGAVGGQRYEQLFRCTGTFEIVGEDVIEFDGPGLFIRRHGARDVGEFPGHCWQSAVFPSGKAFGTSGFPPRADGTPAYNDAFLFDGKKKIYAKLVEGPWMTSFVPHDGPVDLVFETEHGERVKIKGRTYSSTYIAKGNPMFGDWTQEGVHQLVNLPFHQGDAIYEWDGETTLGMIERSYPADKMIR